MQIQSSHKHNQLWEDIIDRFRDSINRVLILVRMVLKVKVKKKMIICVLDLQFRFYKMTLHLPIELTVISRVSILQCRFLHGMSRMWSEQGPLIMCIKWFPISILLCTLVCVQLIQSLKRKRHGMCACISYHWNYCVL